MFMQPSSRSLSPELSSATVEVLRDDLESESTAARTTTTTRSLHCGQLSVRRCPHSQEVKTTNHLSEMTSDVTKDTSHNVWDKDTIPASISNDSNVQLLVK